MYVDKNEVLRYLGYKTGKTKLDQSMSAKIDYYISLGITLLEPKTTYRIFNSIIVDDSAVKIPEASLVLPGKDISNHLRYCQKVCLVAATVGHQLEAKAAELFNTGEYAAATILDAVGSDAVEKAADQLQDNLQILARRIGLPHLTWRFCNGYGDLPLEVQHDLAAAVNAEEIGITVNSSCMLNPQKSIIGIVGLSAHHTDTQIFNKCDKCSAVNCAYRNRGDSCAKTASKD